MKKPIVSFLVGAALASGTAYAAGPSMHLRSGQTVDYGAVSCTAVRSGAVQYLACFPGQSRWAVGISENGIVVLDDQKRTRFSKKITTG